MRSSAWPLAGTRVAARGAGPGRVTGLGVLVGFCLSATACDRSGARSSNPGETQEWLASRRIVSSLQVGVPDPRNYDDPAGGELDEVTEAGSARGDRRRGTVWQIDLPASLVISGEGSGSGSGGGDARNFSPGFSDRDSSDSGDGPDASQVSSEADDDENQESDPGSSAPPMSAPTESAE